MPVKNWSDDILLVELSNDPIFTEEIVAAIEQIEKGPAQDCVLSFQSVTFINSSNLAKLLKLRRMMIENDRQLRLCCINSHAWGVFLATGLDKIFEFADDVTMALASLELARHAARAEEQERTAPGD